jgi:hypothetical protein
MEVVRESESVCVWSQPPQFPCYGRETPEFEHVPEHCCRVGDAIVPAMGPAGDKDMRALSWRGAVRASSSRCLVASRTPFGVRFGWRRPPRGHDTPQPNLQCHRTDWIRRQRPRRPLSHDLISLSLRLALLDSPDSAARKERRKPTCLALSSLRRHHIR